MCAFRVGAKLPLQRGQLQAECRREGVLRSSNRSWQVTNNKLPKVQCQPTIKIMQERCINQSALGQAQNRRSRRRAFNWQTTNVGRGFNEPCDG